MTKTRIELILSKRPTWGAVGVIFSGSILKRYSDCGRCLDIEQDGVLYTIREGMHRIHTVCLTN